MNKIVVTGAGGYIGNQLVRDLLSNGFKVLAIDRFFFGIDPVIDLLEDKNFTLLKKDIRDLNSSDLKGWDAICDLACLSNDPSGEIDPDLTYQINRDGRVHVAKTAKKAGVLQYILSSSCSVYGEGQKDKLNENSETRPLSVYAKSTFEAEQIIQDLSSSEFSVTALRNATVFGLSRRMRFDLVVNLMTLSAFQKSRIIVMGGGSQWRPLVHLKDVSKAFIAVINAPIQNVNSEIFNVGLNNFQIKNLAYLVRENLPNPIEIDIAPDDNDKRDYNVDFSKIKKVLNFEATYSVEDGINEIYTALNKGEVDTGIKTVTVAWYRHILEAKKLIEDVQLQGRVI
jgi:nucleoside-diphosphate-sugar epimerase